MAPSALVIFLMDEMEMGSRIRERSNMGRAMPEAPRTRRFPPPISMARPAIRAVTVKGICMELPYLV
jgi:hypothetical protein